MGGKILRSKIIRDFGVFSPCLRKSDFFGVIDLGVDFTSSVLSGLLVFCQLFIRLERDVSSKIETFVSAVLTELFKEFTIISSSGACFLLSLKR